MAIYVVTGGCGFIGSHLVESLVGDGHSVRILDDLSTGKKENVQGLDCEIHVGDVADSALVRKVTGGADGVFHLAAVASVQRSNEDWLGTHRSNLTGTITVFESARTARKGSPIPVVYASSAAVYGDNANVPLPEEAKTSPLTAYGADKLGSELHGRVATVVHGVPTMGFRFFNVFGPRQDPKSPYSGVISIFASKALNREPLTIHGDGQQQRDFIFVKDVVRFLRAGMERATHHNGFDVFNVCTGRTTTVEQLARAIIEASGNTIDIQHGPARTGDIRVSLGNPGKALALLGLTARVSLAEGLSKTLASLKTS